jgi:hypothetical protein
MKLAITCKMVYNGHTNTGGFMGIMKDTLIDIEDMLMDGYEETDVAKLLGVSIQLVRELSESLQPNPNSDEVPY